MRAFVAIDLPDPPGSPADDATGLRRAQQVLGRLLPRPHKMQMYQSCTRQKRHIVRVFPGPDMTADSFRGKIQ